MKMEDHVKALEEHRRNLDKCVEEGAERNQRNIGFNASQASIEMFSIYLLKHNLISQSVNFDHRIFKRASSVSEKIPFNFPNRGRILELMRKIEEKRLLLCYGKRKPSREIDEMLDYFGKLAKIVGDENEKE